MRNNEPSADLKPRVFMVGRPNKDITLAKKFGEVKGVMQPGGDRHFSPFKPSEYCQMLLDEMRRLRYNCDVDYILVVGSQLPMTLFAATVMSTWGKMKMLMFDATSEQYVERDVDQPVPSTTE